MYCIVLYCFFFFFSARKRSASHVQYTDTNLDVPDQKGTSRSPHSMRRTLSQSFAGYELEHRGIVPVKGMFIVYLFIYLFILGGGVLTGFIFWIGKGDMNTYFLLSKYTFRSNLDPSMYQRVTGYNLYLYKLNHCFFFFFFCLKHSLLFIYVIRFTYWKKMCSGSANDEVEMQDDDIPPKLDLSRGISTPLCTTSSTSKRTIISRLQHLNLPNISISQPQSHSRTASSRSREFKVSSITVTDDGNVIDTVQPEVQKTAMGGDEMPSGTTIDILQKGRSKQFDQASGWLSEVSPQRTPVYLDGIVETGSFKGSSDSESGTDSNDGDTSSTSSTSESDDAGRLPRRTHSISLPRRRSVEVEDASESESDSEEKYDSHHIGDYDRESDDEETDEKEHRVLKDSNDVSGQTLLHRRLGLSLGNGSAGVTNSAQARHSPNVLMRLDHVTPRLARRVSIISLGMGVSKGIHNMNCSCLLCIVELMGYFCLFSFTYFIYLLLLLLFVFFW